MAHHCVHCIVIDGLARGRHGQEHLIWGLVTDLDLMRAATRGTLEDEAGTIAATEVVTAPSTCSVGEAASLMAEHETTHLVIVSSESQTPVGVVSTLDIAGALAPSLRSGGHGT
jgi:CBS domain-containing protein